jgi:hypothetical protein
MQTALFTASKAEKTPLKRAWAVLGQNLGGIGATLGQNWGRNIGVTLGQSWGGNEGKTWVKWGWKTALRPLDESWIKLGWKNPKGPTKSVQKTCGTASGTRRVYSTPLPRKVVIQQATKRRP